MSIEWFEDSQSSNNDLPWLKDYIDEGNDYTTPLVVENCIPGNRGILVLTSEYKAFVFKGSKLANDLLEALSIYTTIKTGVPVLMACGTSNGKVQLGLDHLHLEAVWVKDKNMYIQSIKTEQSLRESRLKADNPLLPKSHPSVSPTATSTPGANGKKPKSAAQKPQETPLTEPPY